MLVDPYFFQEWVSLWRMVCTLEGKEYLEDQALDVFKRSFVGTKYDLDDRAPRTSYVISC